MVVTCRVVLGEEEGKEGEGGKGGEEEKGEGGREKEERVEAVNNSASPVHASRLPFICHWPRLRGKNKNSRLPHGVIVT